MTLRTFIEFTADLPTEQIESETDFIQLGGRPVAEALGGMLARLGCRVEPVASAAHRGWEVRFRYKKLRLWLQVTLISGYLVLIEDRGARWRIFGGPHPDFVELLRRLADELANDGRFHDVGWFHRHEVLSERAGADRPEGAFRDEVCVRLQEVEAPPA